MNRFLFCAFGVLTAAAGYCWGDTGHEVVAAIAWQKMDRTTKIEVSRILMHGDTVTGTRSGQPFTHIVSIPPMRDDELTDRYLDNTVQPVFLLGSVWPDDIKRGKSTHFDPFIDELNGTFPMDHVSESEAVRCKSWHYLDLPIKIDDSGTMTLGNSTEFPYSPSNAESALTKVIQPRLKKIPPFTPAGPDKAAVYLYFAEHIIGDLHQPLHCVSLYGKDYPEGDAGGNLFKLSEGALHAEWDRGIDHAIQADSRITESDPIRRAVTTASTWLTDSTSQPKASDVADQVPLNWVAAGRQYAMSTVYTGIKPGDKPSAEYMKKEIDLCKKQALLAGYRLAEFLKNQLR